jgi:large subunit ribosomal protein L21
MAVSKKTAVKKAESSEFAVIQTGGKQYRVAVGDVVTIEKITGEHKEGDAVVFDKVLLVDDGKNTTIGTPHIDGAKVTGVLKQIGKAKKIEVMKYKAKSRYLKSRGHRQPFFKVAIEKIK